MKIRTEKRGLNKDECYCGSERDIKNMLMTISLDDDYECLINMGEYISRDKNRENLIFKFSYSSFYYKDISEGVYRRHIWFSFYPTKTKVITPKIREEFKDKIIPLLKSEILSCINKNDLVKFDSIIKVSIENSELVIYRDNR